MIYTDVLSSSALDLIKLFNNQTFLSAFYLSGGTGLALQLGHRESEDLDFFSEIEFDPQSIFIFLKANH